MVHGAVWGRDSVVAGIKTSSSTIGQLASRSTQPTHIINQCCRTCERSPVDTDRIARLHSRIAVRIVACIHREAGLDQ
jgi:hypothetical protein